jgi:hypothetical protein
MEGGTLFNPGFLGGSFLWWVGQISDDSTWRENISSAKIENKNDTSGWGYRYKVRIIGLHDQSEASISSDKLPWAQVMYPITAGGGQGGSFHTPALKQGNFVFGFFLDAQDQQVPVIMGVLGNNSKTQLNTKTSLSGGENFTPQSHFSKTQKRDSTKRVADSNLSTEKPSKGFPTKESADATHLESAKDEKKEKVLKRKHTLASPCPEKNSAMKSIQTIMETLSEKIQEIQKSLQNYKDAAALPIKNAFKEIDRVIEEAATEISKFMKEIFANVQNFVTDQFNKTLQPLLNIAPPSSRINLLEKALKGFEALCCIFNKIVNGLLGDILGAILNSFNRKNSASPNSGPTPQTNLDPSLSQPGGTLPLSSLLQGGQGGLGGGAGLGGVGAGLGGAAGLGGVGAGLGGGRRAGISLPTDPQVGTPSEFQTSYQIPSLPPNGFYTPTPICDTEELISEVLGLHLNTIMESFDIAVTPVVFASRDFLSTEGYSGTVYAKQILNAKPKKIIRRSISPSAVKSSIESGELVRTLVSILSGQLGTNLRSNQLDGIASNFRQNPVSGIISLLGSISGTDGDLRSTLLSFANLVNDNPLFSTDNTTASLINVTADLLTGGDLKNGLASIAKLAGADPVILSSIGSTFQAIKAGDILGVVQSLSPLVGVSPELLNLVTDFVDDPIGSGIGLIDDLVGGLGAIGGFNFDVGTALGFISSITELFSCDPKPECSPNDTYTMQEGGNGKPGIEKPNLAAVAEGAIGKAASGGENPIKAIPLEVIPFRPPTSP